VPTEFAGTETYELSETRVPEGVRKMSPIAL